MRASLGWKKVGVVVASGAGKKWNGGKAHDEVSVPFHAFGTALGVGAGSVACGSCFVGAVVAG